MDGIGADQSQRAPKSGEAARRHARDALRHAILSGDFAPGQRLVEEELAGDFRATRASVRAALMDLAAEDLVERIPNRGARVRVVSLEEAVAITECRMVLEGLCAAKAAERVTPAQAAQLRQVGDALKQAVADGETIKYSALNHEVHRLVREQRREMHEQMRRQRREIRRGWSGGHDWTGDDDDDGD